MAAGSNITLALRTAQSGLLVNQQALDAVANNIANVNTEGYSRKVVNLEQRVVDGISAGVEIADVTRKTDEGLLKSLRTEIGTLETSQVKNTYFEQIQLLFGSPEDNTSIGHVVQEFASAMEALAITPDNVLEQQDLVRRASELTLTMRTMSDTIQDLRTQADKDISDKVDEANNLINTIATLNDEIIRNSAVSHDVSDLRDKLDLALDDLSGLMDITYFYRSDADVVVFTADGRSIVSNTPATLTHNSVGSISSTTTHAAGEIQGLYVGGTAEANDITTLLTKGEMAGLIELRDETLPGLQSQLDEMAAQLRDQINLIHNRGIAHPGMQSMTGTRKLIDPATSTISFDGTSDTRVLLFDSNGDQLETTTIRTLVNGSTATIDDMASKLESWLQANGASGASVSTANDVLEIELNSTSVYLGFRDETTSTAGSTHQDATILYDIDGSSASGEASSHTGFSNFFGLNDFLIDGLSENILESDVIDENYTFSTYANYEFRDSTGALGTLSVEQNDTLQDLIDKIEADTTLNSNFRVSLVPDGAGVRLRFAHQSGSDFAIYRTGGTGTAFDDINVHVSDVRTSTTLDVRSDIERQPARVARGSIQWDSSRGVAGEYTSSAGDNSIATAMAEMLTSTMSFEEAGSIGDVTLTLAQYGAAIVSSNSTLAARNDANISRQGALVDSLQFKSDSFKGVNLDEEMAQLIVFEQAYGAAARVITTIKDMFDMLDAAVS